MEWDEKLQLIVDYIEKHLQRMQEPINPQEVAEIVPKGILVYEWH